jgi:hypothetical protein
LSPKTAVRLGVHDSGPGMDESLLAHVFDRFWQPAMVVAPDSALPLPAGSSRLMRGSYG